MNGEQPQAPSAEVDVESLVSRYAPVGRRLRRRRQIARLALAMAVPMIGIAAVILLQPAPDTVGSLPESPAEAAAESSKEIDLESSAERIERALDELRALKESLQAETGAVTAQRAELARQRENVSREKRQLGAQLATINAQRETLAKQNEDIEQQKLVLVKALERTSEERRRLQASTGSRSSIERELLDIDRQKRLLEEQQQQFLEQGQALAGELEKISRQRAEIERQRQTIEEQQAEIGRLLEQNR